MNKSILILSLFFFTACKNPTLRADKSGIQIELPLKEDHKLRKIKCGGLSNYLDVITNGAIHFDSTYTVNHILLFDMMSDTTVIYRLLPYDEPNLRYTDVRDDSKLIEFQKNLLGFQYDYATNYNDKLIFLNTNNFKNDYLLSSFQKSNLFNSVYQPNQTIDRSKEYEIHNYSVLRFYIRNNIICIDPYILQN